jgi:hypothetical protein
MAPSIAEFTIILLADELDVDWLGLPDVEVVVPTPVPLPTPVPPPVDLLFYVKDKGDINLERMRLTASLMMRW